MKKWIPGAELFVRWTISHHDLVEIVMKGDIAAYNSYDLSQYDVDVDADLQNHARFLMEKQGVILTTTMFAKKGFDWHRDEFKKDKIRSLIPAVGGLLFKIEDVVEYERAQGIQRDTDSNAPAPKPESQYSFLKSGEYWQVRFEDEKSALKNQDGMQYIIFLLQRPKVHIHALDLYRMAKPLPPADVMTPKAAAAAELHSPGNVQMSEARINKILWNKINDLQARREEADDIRRDEIDDEIEKHLCVVNDATKIGSIATDNSKDAQAAIRKAVDRAYEKIRKAKMTNLAKHLEANIKPGGGYTYRYVGDLLWKISE